MTPIEVRKDQLEKRLAELGARLNRIERELDQPVSAQFGEQRIDQQSPRPVGILRHGGQRRTGETGGRNIVEPDQRHIVRHPPSAGMQHAHRRQRDQVARRNDRIERHPPRQQFARRPLALFLARQRGHLQRRIDLQPRLRQRHRIAVISIVKFRVMVRRIAQERNPPPPARDQVPCRLRGPRDIVAPDRQPRLPRRHRSPAHEARTLRHQLLQPGAVLGIVPVPQQDQPVRTVAVLIIDMPVAGEILERDQQVVSRLRARAHHRTQHAEEERVDQRMPR